MHIQNTGKETIDMYKIGRLILDLKKVITKTRKTR